MSKPEKLSEEDLRAITDAEMRQAVGYWSGKLASQRQKAMAYYYAEPILDLTPPEIEGRSAVVSPDVRNIIESMLPQLMVKFAATDTVVEFEPRKPGDEGKAEQATDYVNYIYHTRNKGEEITYAWMKDALLSKRGFLKVWWDTRAEEKREEYLGLDEIELAQLMDDEEVEITEQRSYPDEEDAEKRQEALQQMQAQLDQALAAAQQNPQAAQAVGQIQQQMAMLQQQPPKMLWDVVCKRTLSGGRVRIENVPPEEFLISRKAKSIEDAPFVGHRVARTLSELKSMGYKDVDNISGDDQATALNMERIERLAYDDELAYLNVDQPNTLDQSQRIVWVTECYVRVDYDGDGIAELRKVVRAGNRILENEIVDCAPFVSICPVPIPHKFFGLSVADLAMEAQKIKTSLLRANLDNTYLQVNGRYFAVDGQVNLDDLLTSRPGGIVRIKGPGAVGRLDQGMGDGAGTMAMMEWMQGYLEDSTGWTRYNQGTDGDSLNNTATGVNIVTNRADMRLDLIARNFAQGFRDLFAMILKLVAQYQQSEDIIRLRGQFVAMNPREWRNQFDVVINVGLGTGNKDQQVGHLMALLQQQQFGLQIGTVQPANVFEAQKELTKALGFKSGDKFFTDPRQMPPRQQPDPMAAQMQIEQMKAQLKAQTDERSKQAEIALERERMQMQTQVDTHRQQVEAQQKALQLEQEKELQRLRIESEMQLAQAKAAMERDTALEIARLKAETDLVIAQLKQQKALTPQQDMAAEAVIDNGGA